MRVVGGHSGTDGPARSWPLDPVTRAYPVRCRPARSGAVRSGGFGYLTPAIRKTANAPTTDKAMPTGNSPA